MMNRRNYLASTTGGILSLIALTGGNGDTTDNTVDNHEQDNLQGEDPAWEEISGTWRRTPAISAYDWGLDNQHSIFIDTAYHEPTNESFLYLEVEAPASADDFDILFTNYYKYPSYGGDGIAIATNIRGVDHSSSGGNYHSSPQTFSKIIRFPNVDLREIDAFNIRLESGDPEQLTTIEHAVCLPLSPIDYTNENRIVTDNGVSSALDDWNNNEITRDALDDTLQAWKHEYDALIHTY